MVFNIFLFGNTLGQYILAIIIALLGVAIGKVFKQLFNSIIKPLTSKSKTDLDDTIAKIIEMPVRYFIYLYGFVYAYNLLIFPSFVNDVVERMFYMILVVLGCFVAIQIIDLIVYNILTPLAKRAAGDFDDHLIPLIRKTIKVILSIVAVLMVLDNFGFDITTIIAGLGVGGLAFALAAKDMLS